MDAVAGSDAVYGRDVQAQALRELEVVLEAVRLGHFRPDATRSGLFALNFSRDTLLQQASYQLLQASEDPNKKSDEALEIASKSSTPETVESQHDTFWFHPQSTIVHCRVAVSTKFACGRPFQTTYAQVGSSRARWLPQRKSCFEH